VLLKTILLSVIIIGICLVGLSIGLILTGKPKLKKGCGSLPKDKQCGSGSCEICTPKQKKKSD